MPRRNNSGLILWGIYIVFVALAVALNWHDRVFDFTHPLAALKIVIWGVLIAFLAYTIYCSRRENFFRSLKAMGQLRWGVQAGLDLYIGVAMFLVFVALIEGSVWIALFWALPAILFANLATLVYVAIHFETIVDLLTSL
jgi:hypothetical protein